MEFLGLLWYLLLFSVKKKNIDQKKNLFMLQNFYPFLPLAARWYAVSVKMAVSLLCKDVEKIFSIYSLNFLIQIFEKKKNK